MPSRSDLEIKSRLVLGLGLLSLVVVLLLRLLLPLLAIFGLGAMGFLLWRSHSKKRQQQKRQQTRINAKFYKLLQQQQGRISVLDFAMRTQLDGPAAQAYLNRQAQSFSAFFETTPQGDLIYVFSSAAARSNATQAEAAWAYSEQAMEKARVDQARSQRARAQRAQQKAQTAWNNAKQIRTLRQLAKKEQPEARKPTPHKLPHQHALTGSVRPDSPAAAPQNVITIDVTAVRG
jgi:serine/threonine-protein kinase RIO1